MEAVNGSVKFYKEKKTKESPARPEMCKNGGVYSVDNDTCQCEAPYHGTNCTHVYRDCKDIGNTGQTEKRPYLIHPPASPAPFPVFCIPNLGRTYFFQQTKGDVDFNRTWQEYVRGFGQVSGDHWLGLDHVRHLTLNEGKNYGLMFALTLSNGTKVYVLYSDFQLGGADTGYKFTMNPNVPNRPPGDCLSPLVGAPFSTYDNDSDNSTTINCAQRHGWGWWYSGDTCSSVCSALGRLNKNSDL
ncbi:angiopoietin-related protein 4-like, partial [Littorina saxatilis]